MSTLFRNVQLLTAQGQERRGVYVGVRDGKIEYLAPTPPVRSYDEQIDGAGRLLLPGFFNAHSHAAMTLLRGYGDDLPLDRWLRERIFPAEDRLTAQDVYWGSLLAIGEMLAGGIVSFSDMYYFCQSTARAVAESGIKANLGRSVSDTEGRRLRQLPAWAEIQTLLAEWQGAADGRVRIDLAPHSEYTTTPALLHDLAELAAQEGLRIQVHLAETQREVAECVARQGVPPALALARAGIWDVPATAAHCVWLREDERALLGEKGVTVAHCPKSNLKLGSGVARLSALRAQGVSVALGTDSAASNNRLDPFDEMRTAALLQKGVFQDPAAMPAGEALFMATRAGAFSQGRQDCGDIAVGMRADLVLLDGAGAGVTPCHDALSQTVYAAGREDVSLTMVDGRVLYRGGAWTTLDMERIRFEARGAARRLAGE